MLTLNDGRDELWQWDTGRTLAVDADCSQVHFSNKVFGRSIDVDVVDGAAIIPDILLQTDNDLNVWAFFGTADNGYTKISKTFKVNRRNKPADYVFTPTDQMTLQTIQSQIGDLDDLTTEEKDTLVAAINEAARTGGGGGGSTVELDTTLTQSGKAADAKAVGDALAELEAQIPESSGGVSDYTELTNKPKINGVELSGDKTSADLGIGNPTDEQVGTAVNAYLEAHPVDGTNWYVPDAEESFGETGTDGEGSGGDAGGGDEPSGEPSYVTANLAAMYDFTKYEDGYQGEVEDLSGNGVVPTITGLDAYRSGRQGFIGGKLMLGDNTTAFQAGLSTVNKCTMTIDCDAVKSHPYSIEVYGFLRKNFKSSSPAGTLEYGDTSVPGSWNMMVAQTIFSATASTNGWNFVASENYAAMWGNGNAAKLEATDIELSIGGVNNTNVTGADTHLVYCVDGNLQKIYLNGVLVASAEVARDHATDNILKVFPLMLAADLKMFRLYKSVLSDFDVYTNYQQAVSTYSGAAPVALAAEVTEEDTVTRKAIKEMDNFPVTLARATYMNNSNTTVEDEINTLKSGGANSATVVRSAEVGSTGVVAFKNAAGITVFEADLEQMMPGALQLPRVYLTGSTVDMGKDSPVKMAFKFVDAEQTITGWADVEWQGNTSIVFPIKNYGIDLYEDEAMATKMDISVLPHMATDSYHLKANYIDPSNVKNLAGARLFKYMCDTVGLTFPNSARCVVDGRPVEVYVNGKFNGIYTLNYKQSKSLFGMGNGNAEFVYRCEVGTGWGLFEGTSFPTKEEFDLIWEARYPKPKNLTNHNEIQRMLKWVNDATANEFKTNIGSYLNLQSCLIYRICGDIMAFRDNSAKNLTVCSWDGQVWYTIPYDMDMGMMDKTDSGMVNAGGNLWSKLDANFDAEKKAMYAQLRNAGMDANTIFKLYSDILYPIGVNGYTADRKVKYDPYTNIDSRVSFVDFDDYIGFHKEFIQARIGLMDEKYGYTAT